MSNKTAEEIVLEVIGIVDGLKKKGVNSYFGMYSGISQETRNKVYELLEPVFSDLEIKRCQRGNMDIIVQF
jgi:hypothetical protein